MTFIYERPLYFKKICAHLRDVIKYEFSERFGKISFISLCDFCFMRWAIPTGLVAANNAHNINSNQSKLSSDGYMVLEEVPESIITEIQNSVKQRLDTHEAFGDIDAYSLCMISQGRQREILMASEGEYSCPLAKLARSKAYVELACDYLGLPKEKLMSIEELFSNLIIDEKLHQEILNIKDPKTIYVIAITPRSGSSYLCDIMKSSKILGSPGEFLPPVFMQKILSEVLGHGIH